MDRLRSDTMFCIVDFVGGRKRTVVPDTWMSINDTLCLLPPNATDSDLEALVRNHAEPGQGWQMLEVSSLETCESYSEAKKQLEKSRESPQSESNSSRRKRKKPSYLQDYSTRDSDNDRQQPYTVFGMEFDEEAMSENEWAPPLEISPRVRNVSSLKKTIHNDSEKEFASFLDSKWGRKNNLLEKDVSQKEKKKSTEMFFSTRNNLRSVFSDSDSEDCITTTQVYKEEISELKTAVRILSEKNCHLKAENKILKMKLEEVYSLNIKLQKKLLESLEAPAIQESTLLESTLSIDNVSPTEPSNSPSQSLPCSNEVKIVPDQIALISDDTLIPDIAPIVPESSPAVMEQVEEKPYHLEESHLNRVTLRVKPGQYGDSMFVKNLSLAVFGEEVLVKSSVTGVKCNSKKESIARPALCPKRLNYIKKLFQERIERENPECPIEEKIKRLNKLNAFVAEKIITLGRIKK